MCCAQPSVCDHAVMQEGRGARPNPRGACVAAGSPLLQAPPCECKQHPNRRSRGSCCRLEPLSSPGHADLPKDSALCPALATAVLALVSAPAFAAAFAATRPAASLLPAAADAELAVLPYRQHSRISALPSASSPLLCCVRARPLATPDRPALSLARCALLPRPCHATATGPVASILRQPGQSVPRLLRPPPPERNGRPARQALCVRCRRLRARAALAHSPAGVAPPCARARPCPHPKGGEFINKIKEKTGARISVDKPYRDYDERIIHIESDDT